MKGVWVKRPRCLHSCRHKEYITIIRVNFFFFWGRGCFVVLWLDFSNGGFVHVCMHVCVSARARPHTYTCDCLFCYFAFSGKRKTIS